MRMLVLELLLSAGMTLSGTLFVVCAGRSEPSPEVSFRIECFGIWTILAKIDSMLLIFWCPKPVVIEEMFQLLEPSKTRDRPENEHKHLH